jgi:hypothetical protein
MSGRHALAILACAHLVACTHPPQAPEALPAPTPALPEPTPRAAIPEAAPPQPVPMVLAPLPGCSVPPGAVLEEPEIVGSLDDEAVTEAVYRQLDRIQGCIDYAVSYDLFSPGQLVVRLSVAPAGRVTSVDVAADGTGGDPEVHGCLVAAFDELVFPRTSTVTWVCYPINVAYELGQR